MPSPVVDSDKLPVSRALHGYYRDLPAEQVELAVSAAINRRTSQVLRIVADIQQRPDGVDALVRELQGLAREGWYRSFVTLLSCLSRDVIVARLDDLLPSIREVSQGVTALALPRVATALSQELSRLSEVVRGISVGQVDPQNSPVPKEHLKLLYALRESSRSSSFNATLASLTPTQAYEAMEAFLSRDLFPWAIEMVELTYGSERIREEFRKENAITQLLEKLIPEKRAITIRHLAEVVRERPEYRIQFCARLGLKDW